MQFNCHQFDCVTFFSPPFHILVRRLKRNDCRDQVLNFISVRNSSSAREKNNIDLTTDKWSRDFKKWFHKQENSRIAEIWRILNTNLALCVIREAGKQNFLPLKKPWILGFHPRDFCLDDGCYPPCWCQHGHPMWLSWSRRITAFKLYYLLSQACLKEIFLFYKRWSEVL